MPHLPVVCKTLNPDDAASSTSIISDSSSGALQLHYLCLTLQPSSRDPSRLPAVADGAARSSKPNSGINSNVNSSRPLYRGNLSGTGNDTRPTTAVTPEDVLAATQAENAAAAATVASASKPVVKFVPKRISLFGGQAT